MSPRSTGHLRIAVWTYAIAVSGLWLAIEWLVDRAWPATLAGFGPRWVSAVPLPLLAAWALATPGGRRERLPLAVLLVTGSILLFGVMDLRLGLGRASGPADIQVMTHNLGGSRVTAEALDRLMRAERVDVAALQECPFYSLEPARLGWEFFYGGNLCLVSRFPFRVLDADPHSLWTRSPHTAMRFELQTPVGAVQLINVHFETIREGLEALGTTPWRGIGEFAANRRQAARDSRRARDRLLSASGPVIVAGDFNLPPESVVYRAHWGDLQNAFSTCGRGFGRTKFTRAFGIRIDHVVTGRGWRCTDARVLPTPYGGDHRPLVAGLQLR